VPYRIGQQQFQIFDLDVHSRDLWIVSVRRKFLGVDNYNSERYTESLRRHMLQSQQVRYIKRDWDSTKTPEITYYRQPT
jgi:hypothetical protein